MKTPDGIPPFVVSRKDKIAKAHPLDEERDSPSAFEDRLEREEDERAYDELVAGVKREVATLPNPRFRKIVLNEVQDAPSTQAALGRLFGVTQGRVAQLSPEAFATAREKVLADPRLCELLRYYGFLTPSEPVV